MTARANHIWRRQNDVQCRKNDDNRTPGAERIMRDARRTMLRTEVVGLCLMAGGEPDARAFLGGRLGCACVSQMSRFFAGKQFTVCLRHEQDFLGPE